MGGQEQEQVAVRLLTRSNCRPGQRREVPVGLLQAMATATAQQGPNS